MLRLCLEWFRYHPKKGHLWVSATKYDCMKLKNCFSTLLHRKQWLVQFGSCFAPHSSLFAPYSSPPFKPHWLPEGSPCRSTFHPEPLLTAVTLCDHSPVCSFHANPHFALACDLDCSVFSPVSHIMLPRSQQVGNMSFGGFKDWTQRWAPHNDNLTPVCFLSLWLMHQL